MESGFINVGKLPMELLRELLARYAGQDERLVVGPRIGEDATVLDMGERYLVVKSDPVTFATDEIGWYVVHVNANDLATMGATPRWMLLTLLLPAKQTTKGTVERIFEQVSQACKALGIVLCGGHTEITYGLDRPIAVGLMLGEVEKVDLVCTSGARPGDDVILTKGIALEGTAVLALEKAEQLRPKVGAGLVARSQRLLREPGISVLQDAQVVCQAGRPHAMHDPTEGGLATGLWELAQASGNGIAVEKDRIYLFPETAAICQAMGLDPMGLLASGALLVTAAPGDAARMLCALAEAGINAWIIGKVVSGSPTVYLGEAGAEPMRTFERDELARLFD